MPKERGPLFGTPRLTLDRVPFEDRKFREGAPEHFQGAGYMETGDGHSVYWERWGNPESKPIIHLHGGPGASVTTTHFELYDFTKHNTVFFDQRGCGKSVPFGEIRKNNTKLLIGDIERLRKHLGIKGTAYMVGGSWGSTLGEAYQGRYPNHVEKAVYWSQFSGRDEDIDCIYEPQDNPDFPQAATARFLSHVPEAAATSPRSALQYYAEKIFSNDPEEARQFAKEYHLNTYTLCSLPDFNLEETEQELAEDPNLIAYARVEINYLLNMGSNDAYKPKIFENLRNIRKVPTTLISGTLDYCTPIAQAYELKAAWPELNHVVVPSGHIRYDERGMKQAIQAAIADFV